ncbi:hypothetical protein DL93DRAFT_2223639 [Clavulina sp. PMI_390]|nr:hypothetical protein DL93DRAFT_2223639 [Clavulina sp. PMI_390]
MSLLAKGGACLPCRKLKMRCDGIKPICSRCERLAKDCTYPSGLARRLPLTQTLEARALELETLVNQLKLSAEYDLGLAAGRLRERVGRLGVVSVRETPPIVKYELDPTRWAGLKELPSPLSLALIEQFLPYRAYFFFFMDVTYFRRCLSLPPCHPDAIHPCLLNACYLGACSWSGGRWTYLEPYFVNRTRYFLNQSLMYADRISHFLWASVLLGCYFTKERRLAECLAVVGSATRFAMACGLDLPSTPTSDGASPSSGSESLLPPPKNSDEAIDRTRLAYSIYIADQALPTMCGCPSTLPYDDRWATSTSEEVFVDDQVTKIEGTGIPQRWQSITHLRLLITRIFERANNLATIVCSNGFHGLEGEYRDLEDQIHTQQSSLPPLRDPRGLSPSEAAKTFNASLLLAHIMLCGSELILHSLRSGEDAEARRKMLHCVQKLLDICEIVRNHKKLHTVRVGLVNAIHAMNAVRAITRELRRPETIENARLSVSYCEAIEMLLDFLDEIVSLFPAWAQTPALLKDPLLAVASSVEPRSPPLSITISSSSSLSPEA